MNENGMNYMAYNWNEKDNSWNLVTEQQCNKLEQRFCWQTDNYSNKNSLLQFQYEKRGCRKIIFQTAAFAIIT